MRLPAGTPRYLGGAFCVSSVRETAETTAIAVVSVTNNRGGSCSSEQVFISIAVARSSRSAPPQGNTLGVCLLEMPEMS